MSLQVIDPMAKDRPKADRPAPAPKGKPSNRKVMAIQVRGTPEYKTWVEIAAAKDRSSLAAFVDRAIRDRAKAIGLEVEPPER